MQVSKTIYPCFTSRVVSRTQQSAYLLCGLRSCAHVSALSRSLVAMSSLRNGRGTSGTRLSIIVEDGFVPNEPRQSRTSHRPFSRRWKDEPPRPSFEASPPEYNVWDAVGPKGERLLDLRNHKHIAKRGGWKRFLLIILVTIAALVALGVGLGIGLTRKYQENGYAALLSPFCHRLGLTIASGRAHLQRRRRLPQKRKRHFPPAHGHFLPISLR